MEPFAVVDTSFILAVIDARDTYHRKAAAYYRGLRQACVFPASALAEVAYHMHKVGGNALVAQVLTTLRQSPFTLIDLIDQDYDRTADILRKYHDTRIDFVDASVMAVAERLNIARVLTFDHIDFRIYQPTHVKSFIILP